MPDPVRGVLTWRDGRALVAFPTRRGIGNAVPVPPGHLAEELSRPRAEPQEVDLGLEGGQPRRVRPVGTAWVGAAAPPHVPQRREPAGRRFGPQGSNPRSQPRADAPDGRPGFHNPYGFVRTPDRLNLMGDLGDRRPPSHGWFDPDRWSGRIAVELTVETPLLIPDSAEVETNSDGHKTYPVRLAPDGSPYLPPTSVKGTLRAAYEAVTNSRLGVFAGHDRRLGFRMAATEGLAMVPGRTVGDRVELLMGTNPNLPQPSGNGRWGVPTGVMYAAWLPRYRDERFNIRYPDRSLPRHGDAVCFWAELIRHRSDRFSFWEVRRIAREGDPLSPKPTPRAGGEVREFAGWVCITNQNINRKHDERVFFAKGPTAPRVYPLTEALKKGWRDLIAEYRALHEDEIEKRRKDGKRPDQYLGHEPGKTAFSRHVYAEADRMLAEGALVYVRPDQNGNPVGIYPVTISRELHPAAPWALLDPSLRPAEEIDELSPADRVFGWVRQREGGKGLGAYRGNLRLGPIVCMSADAVQRFGSPLPLAILGQPKPNQARFYLVSEDGKTLSGRPVREAYRQGNRLQGRKAYPHHAKLDRAHWDDAEQDHTSRARSNGTYQEYRRVGSKADHQNRSVEGWVKPGSVFAFDIHVTNFSDIELGALLWLLELGDPNRPRFFRLGGGKPLGFGSARLRMTGNSLAKGAALAESYRGFEIGGLPPADGDAAKKLVEAFKASVEAAYGGNEFEKVAFVADSLVAANGFRDGFPIHYPRTMPAPSIDGENFKWFQENERGSKAALANLAMDRGLPNYNMDPTRVQIQDPRTNQWLLINRETGQIESSNEAAARGVPKEE